MEFYEDPFGFDVNEAKARKEKEEALENGEEVEHVAQNSNIFEDDADDKLLKDEKPQMENIKLPNKALNTRVEESFNNNPLLKGKSLDKLKTQAYFLVT